ncbi:hypothetical protein ACJX0J_027529 [Zea mays]
MSISSPLVHIQHSTTLILVILLNSIIDQGLYQQPNLWNIEKVHLEVQIKIEIPIIIMNQLFERGDARKSSISHHQIFSHNTIVNQPCASEEVATFYLLSELPKETTKNIIFVLNKNWKD